MKKNLKRDNFSKTTIDILGKRVGYICSNPFCKKPTIGPNTQDLKATTIGVAAHITAASVGGPRYDDTLSSLDRTNIKNGIWLCSNCASLIDKDEYKYPTPLLLKWKLDAEHDAQEKIESNSILMSERFVYKADLSLITSDTTRINVSLKIQNLMKEVRFFEDPQFIFEVADGTRLDVPLIMMGGQYKSPVRLEYGERYANKYDFTSPVFNKSRYYQHQVSVKAQISTTLGEKASTNTVPFDQLWEQSQRLKVKLSNGIEADLIIPIKMLVNKKLSDVETLIGASERKEVVEGYPCKNSNCIRAYFKGGRFEIIFKNLIADRIAIYDVPNLTSLDDAIQVLGLPKTLPSFKNQDTVIRWSNVDGLHEVNFFFDYILVQVNQI